MVMRAINKRGGITRYVTSLAEQYVKSHEVHIITADYETPVKGAIPHVHRIFSKPPSLNILSNVYANAKTIAKVRMEEGIDVVHSQGAESIRQDIITSQSCQKAAVEHQRKERGGLYNILKPFEPRSNVVLAVEAHNFKKRNYRMAIAVSEGVKRELIHHYGVPDEDIKVIPNGVDLEEFKPENRGVYREPVRRELGISPEDTVLVLTAWEYNRKGVRHIIEALPMLEKDVKLVVVGGDNEKPYLNLAERLGVKDRVFFTGPRSDVQRYYGASDLFVFPTSYEAFSLSTLEAAASGLPLLATKVNGTEELIKDGENGFFVERDGGDIADKVRKAMDLGINKVSANARKSAMQYSWEKIAEQTIQTYREALE